MPPLRSAAAIAAAWLLAGVAGQTTTTPEPWVSPADDKALVDAKRALETYCVDGLSQNFQEDGRKTLESNVGHKNIILEAMVESKSSNELGDNLTKKLDIGALVVNAGPIVLAIIMAIIYVLYCCWSSWPCCKCCRCCARLRKTWRLAKLFLLLLGLAILVGVIAAAFVAYAGYTRAVDGFDNMACTTARLLNAVLAGQEGPDYFLGMLPVLKEFQEIDDSLADDSNFMTGVHGKIDSTQAINDSLNLATEMLALLNDTFSHMPAEIATNKHRCAFCTSVQDPLDQTIHALRTGIASALEGARNEVAAQLSPETSAALQKNLRDAGAPLAQGKSQLRDTFAFFTDSDQLLQVKGQLDGDGPQSVKKIVGIIIFIAFILSAFMLFTLFWFCCRETYGELDIKDESGKPVPKFSKVTHRCACCNWCSAFYFMLLTLILGGIMSVVSYFGSSMCLIMVDMDSDMIRRIGPSVGLNLDNASADNAMVLDILDQCFFAPPGSNAELFRILKVKDNATATEKTLREKIVDEVKDQVNSKFNEVGRQMNGAGNVSLANNSAVLGLIEIVSTPVDMLITVDPDLQMWTHDADYQLLFMEPPLESAFVSSVRCADGNVPDAFPEPLGGAPMNGIDQFVSVLRGYGTFTAGQLDCAKTVDCNLTAPDPCRAANKYVELKKAIRGLTNFRCDVFFAEDGISDCDPFYMTGDFNSGTNRTTYTNSCLTPGGTLRRKEKTCNFQEFVTYVGKFATRIDKTMRRVDDTAQEVMTDITVGMKDLVNEYLISPIERVADGVTCGFLGHYFKDMTKGLCFQAVAGFSHIGKAYVAIGILCLFIVILMYGVWRRSLDNVNAVIKMQTQVAPM